MFEITGTPMQISITTAVVLLVLWVIYQFAGKKYIETLIQAASDRGVEEYRHRLKVSADEELERLKAELQRLGKDREILLSEVKRQQIAIIAEFYSRLAIAFSYAADAVSPGSQNETLAKQVEDFAKVFNEFRQYFFTHRIFLPQTICEHSDELNKKLYSAILKRKLSKEADLHPKEKLDFWIEAQRIFDEDATSIKSQVEEIFRKLLIVEEN
ncbi:MAG: hypothetical protein JSS75_13390 [Bacteroidetes bacterium]|nr:hypothetical protein [Bacteroidota bacterium]